MSEALLDDWSEDEDAGDAGKAAEEAARQAAEAEENEGKGGRANDRIRQLIQEREAERVARAALEERVRKMEGLETTVKDLLAERKAAAEKAAAPAPVVVPDFVEDPVGHVDAKVGKLQSEIARLEKLAADGNAKAEEEARQGREQLALMQFSNRVQSSEATFSEAHPDYYKALDHSRAVRVQEMEYLGMDKAEIAKAINTEEVNAAMAALARGKDPAEFAYKRAVAMGFKGDAPGASPASAAADKKLQAEIDLYEKRRMASSIGSGDAGEGGELEEAGDAWAAVESAFQELYGEKLR